MTAFLSNPPTLLTYLDVFYEIVRSFLQKPLLFFFCHRELIYFPLKNVLTINSYQCDFWKKLFANTVLVLCIHAVIDYYNQRHSLCFTNEVFYFLQSGPNILIICCLIIYVFEIKNLFMCPDCQNSFSEKNVII